MRVFHGYIQLHILHDIFVCRVTYHLLDKNIHGYIFILRRGGM